MSAMTCNERQFGYASARDLHVMPIAVSLPSKSNAAPAPFQRPGPDILNRTIPVVFIGQNRDGFWVVRDSEARFGGLFWRKDSAVGFARARTNPGGCAAVFPQARFELDLDNHGNPLLIGFGRTKRQLMRRVLRWRAFIRGFA